MSYQKFLSALFDPTDIIQVNGPHPANVHYSGPVSGLQSPAEFISINPLVAPTHTKAMAADVKDFRHFLLEFDSVSVTEQDRLISELEKVIPVRTVTYSGGKSLHAIIALQDTLIAGDSVEHKAKMFKEFAQGLIQAATAYLDPLVREQYVGRLIDRANVDASRLSRLGGAVNRQYKDPEKPHTQQDLLRVGAFATSEALTSFIGQHRPRPAVIEQNKQAVYHGTFEKTLETQSHLTPLRRKFQIPEAWAGPAGNHPFVLQYSLWAIDATGVSKAELLQYLHKYTVPYLASIGYETWKVDAAVDGAYRLKQIRGRF